MNYFYTYEQVRVYLSIYLSIYVFKRHRKYYGDIRNIQDIYMKHPQILTLNT